MGNKSATLSFQENPNYKVEILYTICDNTDLKFEKTKLFAHLAQNPTKKVKIITVVGDAGEGKSTVIEFIASKFLKKEYSLFKSYDGTSNGTKGIHYFIMSIDQQTELVLFDCEGFENANQSDNGNFNQNYNDSLYLFVAQIARLSTVTIHVSKQDRLKNSFCNFIKSIDIENNHRNDPGYLKKKGILSNFIEVLNDKDDLKCTKARQYPIFHKSYFLPKFKKNENSITVTHEFQQQLELLYNDIKTLQFSSIHQNTRGFQQNQNCKSLFEVLLGSFALLKNKLGINQRQHFAELINLQLEQKIFVSDQIEKIQSQFCQKVKKELEELLKIVPRKNFISLQIIQTILQTKQLQANSEFNRKIIDLQRQWRQNFEEGLKIILKADGIGNANQNQEDIQRYLNMEALRPAGINLEPIRNGDAGRGLAVYTAGGAVAVTGILTTGTTVLEGAFLGTSGFRGLAAFGPVGLIVSGALTMSYGLYKILEFQSGEKRIKKWKNNLKKKLTTDLNYSKLICKERGDLRHNLIVFKQNLIELTADDVEQNLFSKYSERELEVFIPLFFFNQISKSLKKKNIEKMQNQETERVFEPISKFICLNHQKCNEQTLIRVLNEILDFDFTQEEKKSTKEQKYNEVFNTLTHEFKSLNFQQIALRMRNKCLKPNTRDNGDLLKLISCFLMCKICASDIFYSFLFSFLFPVDMYQSEQITNIEGITKYFEFQSKLLELKMR